MLMLIKKQSGFTIVELLIVVVVVAILATISIVAYSGIQDRAEVSKTVSAVKSYRDALTLYETDNGSYPTTGAFCLGDQYGLFTGGSVPSCRYSTAQIAVTSGAAQRNLLKPYLGGQLPMPSTKFINVGSTEFVGAHFYGSNYNYTLDGSSVVAIDYFVKGDTCPVGPVYSTGGSPNFLSPSVTRTAAYDDGSRCFLLLSNN